MLMKLEIKLPWLLLCLNLYIIIWLHLFHLENVELLMLVHVRLHGIEAFSDY